MLIVQKFGGSSIADGDRLRRAAGICMRQRQNGNEVVVVVSAMGDTTDLLADRARVLGGKPSPREMDALITTGEQQSAALLVMTMESLGIPVMVERSSYEEHPLGRLEWIRLYGLLYGKEQEADAFYEEQLKKIEPIMEKEDTGRTVAFFYITANGAVNVRKPNDYIAQMIGLAGGTYVLNDRLSAEENALSTMNMQMEDFYAAAKDADILIYNSTIEGELYSVDELLAKSTLFSDFKAVKEGNVYCTGSNFFQESTGTCDFIEDLHKVLVDETDDNYRFLKHVR